MTVDQDQTQGQTTTKDEPYTVEELNRMFSEGEQVDKELFSEQRSNILLSAGEHFTKKDGYFWSRIREARTLSQDQKLRITKNHTHKIVRTYVNNILTLAPDVKAMPQDQKDLRHVKAAELSNSIWEYAKNRHDHKAQVAACAKDFIEAGEVFLEVIYDPNKGRFLGFEQEVDDDGFPLFTDANGESTQQPSDQMGQPYAPQASKQAAFSGDLVANRILAANVIRPADAKTIAGARWLCVREMVHIDDLKKLVGNDEEKLKALQPHQDETFFVFEASRNRYGQTKNQTLVRKFYFRPSPEFPKGYYMIATKEAILFKGELPFGIFPLIYQGFDEIATTPRHRSIIKQIRPIQSEINRSASKMAETQITLGDDKVILQNGSKVTTGPQLPGIRTMFVTGQAPTIMPGRTGDQYLTYCQSQIDEIYQVANVNEDSEIKPGTDPWANLFASMREKKKFSIYAEKFERFLVEWFQLYMELAKNYSDENTLVPAVGKSEYINISEFKCQEPLFTRIKAMPQTDDINTVMGKTMVFNHILQYAASSLNKDDIGKIIRMMPLANSDEAFDDFTLDYDASTNIILALDRGESVQPNKSDNADYINKRLAARQKKGDYRLLSPQIQQNYDSIMQAYDQQMAQQAQALKQAQSQFIPSGGAMIKCDYYIQDPTNNTRSIRATVPAESIDWLIKTLAAQGSAQDQLMAQPQPNQNDIAQKIAAQGPVPRQLMNPQGPQPQGPATGGPPPAGSPAWLAMKNGA